MEGNKLVGKFTRKDNGKVLTAFREIIGDEIVQVSEAVTTLWIMNWKTSKSMKFGKDETFSSS